MNYDRKKKFVLGYLADGQYHYGISIIKASRGQLRRTTAYQTFGRMIDDSLICAKGRGRAWEQEYRLMGHWEKGL